MATGAHVQIAEYLRALCAKQQRTKGTVRPTQIYSWSLQQLLKISGNGVILAGGSWSLIPAATISRALLQLPRHIVPVLDPANTEQLQLPGRVLLHMWPTLEDLRLPPVE